MSLCLRILGYVTLQPLLLKMGGVSPDFDCEFSHVTRFNQRDVSRPKSWLPTDPRRRMRGVGRRAADMVSLHLPKILLKMIAATKLKDTCSLEEL